MLGLNLLSLTIVCQGKSVQTSYNWIFAFLFVNFFITNDQINFGCIINEWSTVYKNEIPIMKYIVSGQDQDQESLALFTVMPWCILSGVNGKPRIYDRVLNSIKKEVYLVNFQSS